MEISNNGLGWRKDFSQSTIVTKTIRHQDHHEAWSKEYILLNNLGIKKSLTKTFAQLIKYLRKIFFSKNSKKNVA